MRSLARTFRERMELIRALRSASPVPVAALSVGYGVFALLPAASAAAMGLLIARVQSATGGLATAALPLALFVTVLLLGHLIDTGLEPLRYLVKARIDGAQRVAVAQAAASVPTLDRLEDPRVQDMIRIASADPGNWTEHTPGDGALAQLDLLARYVAATAAAMVLVSFAWWLVPAVVGPALVTRLVRRRDHVTLARVWARGIRDGRRADYWRRVVMSPAEGKEQRVYGFGEWATRRVLAATHSMFDPVWALSGRFWWRNAASGLLMFVSLAAGYAVVAAAVVRGNATGALQTAIFAAGMAVYFALSSTLDGPEIEGALPVLRAGTTLREALDHLEPTAEGREPTVGGRAALTSTGDRPPVVELSRVRFAYPGSERRVLDGLDLTIQPGELLAIVGLNGAGKSTLIKLVCGLYEPTEGRITADGVDIRQIGLPTWRAQLAVVFQDFVRYHLSAADNVALGHAWAPRNQTAIDRAVAGAGLGDVIDQLPGGWATPLARNRPDGVDLSGGQWQQVALARALYAVYSGARVLVLDEPTAHLDVRSEVELFDRLTDRPANASILLISHRLSTVRRADRIVLLAGGRVSESGTHDELMRLGGAYADMFHIQAARFTAEDGARIGESEGP